MPKTNNVQEKEKLEKKTKKMATKIADGKEETKKKTAKKTATTKKETTKKNVAKKETEKKEVKKEEKAKKVAKKTDSKKETTKTTEKTARKSSKQKVDVKPEDLKETVVKRKVEKLENLEKKENQVKEKVDEASVIEKIKNFLSKIVAMQEESSSDNGEKKTKAKKVSSKKEKAVAPDYLLEYYDLPYRYNETVVKILAQTPKRLFVYWDISDNDREKYIKTFGDDFFYKTYPVLLLYNEDKKYMREIAINDFANSWYVDIPDPKNKYIIQLGRKFKDAPQIVNVTAFEQEKIILRTDYLPFADSNTLEVPNDHVLLESLPRFLRFRNVKTNQEIVKDLRSFKDIFGKTYSVKEFYKTEYSKELSEEGMFDMENPSSKLSSSTFR